MKQNETETVEERLARIKKQVQNDKKKRAEKESNPPKDILQ